MDKEFSPTVATFIGSFSKKIKGSDTFHFEYIDIQSKEEIKNIPLKRDMYVIRLEDIELGYSILEYLKNEKFILTNIPYKYGIYYEIPKEELYDFISHFFIPLYESTCIGMDYIDIINLSKNGNKINFRDIKNKEVIDIKYPSYIIFGYKDQNVSLKEIDRALSQFVRNKGIDIIYASMKDQEDGIYLYEFIKD